MKTRSSSTKIRVDITCPTCSMSLTDKNSGGFVMEGETYCCEGCATGAGCSCEEPAITPRKVYNRPGTLGQRNRENSAKDANANGEVTTSGNVIGKRKPTAKKAPGTPSRDQLLNTGVKRVRGQTKQRDSQREPARGRSEFRGQLNKTAVAEGRADRTGGTAAKNNPGELR